MSPATLNATTVATAMAATTAIALILRRRTRRWTRYPSSWIDGGGPAAGAALPIRSRRWSSSVGMVVLLVRIRRSEAPCELDPRLRKLALHGSFGGAHRVSDVGDS